MKTSQTIFELKTKIKKLKNGGYVSPDSMGELLPKKELLKLYQFWYEEKPKEDIVKPEAVKKYEEYLEIIEFLEQKIIEDMMSNVNILDSDLEEKYALINQEAWEFFVTEYKKDSEICLWFNCEAPFSKINSNQLPVRLGKFGTFSANMGYEFCPSTKTRAEKIAALELILEKICNQHESKILTSFMTDRICDEAQK